MGENDDNNDADDDNNVGDDDGRDIDGHDCGDSDNDKCCSYHNNNNNNNNTIAAEHNLGQVVASFQSFFRNTLDPSIKRNTSSFSRNGLA